MCINSENFDKLYGISQVEKKKKKKIIIDFTQCKNKGRFIAPYLEISNTKQSLYNSVTTNSTKRE